MKFRPACAAVAVVCLLGPARLSADVIVDWNNVLLQAIRTESSSPLKAGRSFAMVQTSVYEAVNSIDRTHRPYQAFLPAVPGASSEAAVAQAAHGVLSSLFPAQQATFDAALANGLSTIPDGSSKADGLSLGAAAANAMINLRLNDHSSDVVPYTPGSGPDDWQPTPPAFAPAAAPNWATVTPFAMTHGAQFRDAVGPPDLNSPEFTAAYNEVKELGIANSATRTADQTDIARFWAGTGGTSTPPGHWNRIAQTVSTSQALSLSENSRLFALLGIALADGSIAAWDNKYVFEFVRPVTAIRNGDADGNDDTAGDTNWLSLIATPNHPSYSSGHSTISSAAARVLAEFLGDDIAFTSSAEGFAVGDRSFTSFSAAAQEAADSRLFAGIHWRFDNEDGLVHGNALGGYVFATQLRPVPEPGSLILLVLGLAGCLAWRRSGRVS